MKFLIHILIILKSSFYELISSKATIGTIIGSGRIGSFLYKSNNNKDIILSRSSLSTEQFPDNTGPIYVCTRNDDL